MSGVWRGALIPDCMGELPRTPGGAPVPYTAAWSSEEGGVKIEPDPLLIRHLGERSPAVWQAQGGIGEGAPKLAKMDAARQRWCTVLRACQVCTQPADRDGGGHGSSWLVDMRSTQAFDPSVASPDGQRFTLPDGRRVPLIRDPWICEDCLEFSLRACGGLKARRQAQTLRLYLVFDYKLVAAFEKPGEDVEVTGTVPRGGAIGTVKIAVAHAAAVSPYEFLRARREAHRAAA